MGSTCSNQTTYTKYIDTEIPQEQSINQQQYELNPNLITYIHQSTQYNINSSNIETKLLKTEFTQQSTPKKGILKNKNQHYQTELLLLNKGIKESNDNYECKRLIEYLKARKQSSY